SLLEPATVPNLASGPRLTRTDLRAMLPAPCSVATTWLQATLSPLEKCLVIVSSLWLLGLHPWPRSRDDRASGTQLDRRACAVQDAVDVVSDQRAPGLILVATALALEFIAVEDELADLRPAWIVVDPTPS